MKKTCPEKSSFTSEINAIKSNTTNNLKNQLRLAKIESGIPHCHGRVIRENLPETTPFPKLLPNNQGFINLAINSLQLMHGGESQTLSCNYQKRILDTQERPTVRQGLLNCRCKCRGHQGGPYRMPPDGSIPTLKNRRVFSLYIYRP